MEAIISMSLGIFKPYIEISTGVLFFKKGDSTKKVCFYDMKNDGFTLDDKRNIIGGGSGDIPNILSLFKNRFYKKNDQDLSINKYKEIEYGEIIYRKSKVILKKLKII